MDSGPCRVHSPELWTRAGLSGSPLAPRQQQPGHGQPGQAQGLQALGYGLPQQPQPQQPPWAAAQRPPGSPAFGGFASGPQGQPPSPPFGRPAGALQSGQPGFAQPQNGFGGWQASITPCCCCRRRHCCCHCCHLVPQLAKHSADLAAAAGRANPRHRLFRLWPHTALCSAPTACEKGSLCRADRLLGSLPVCTLDERGDMPGLIDRLCDRLPAL